VTRDHLPLWLKIAYTLFLVVWIPAYWETYGWQNFLWICDLANFVIAAALWLESPLLVASQAVSVLVIQALWVIDVLTRLAAGFHPIGGTEYMFDPAKPLAVRLLSLFHAFIPILLLWLIWRLGYDRRGWWLQSAITWLLLPVTYLVTDPTKNINWIWKPFGIEQSLIPPGAFLLVEMVALPLLLYLPTHSVLLAWARHHGRPFHPDPGR
jgi:hypothetical protein